MPELSHHSKTLEAISLSTIHQSLSTPSSQVAIQRARSSTLNDPGEALELMRSLIQPSINEEIRRVLQRFSDTFFKPALRNARSNLGDDKVSDKLLEDLCISVLENAKAAFASKTVVRRSKKLKRKASTNLNTKCDNKVNEPVDKKIKTDGKSPRPYTDLILVSKSGKPVRREGPKWDPHRLTKNTLFILGSKANKALGFGQTRGRLYIKHPELFKYSGDQEDKEWLAKNEVMNTTGGKAFLMVLEDVMDLAKSPDYLSHPRKQHDELVGFTVPDFMLTKMRYFISTVQTNPEIPDSELLRTGEEQIARWEEERKQFVSSQYSFNKERRSKTAVSDDVQDILNEIKKEEGDQHNENEEDELGFLHGMNLTNLVREFEMEAANGNGAQHLGILSLADADHVAEVFPELPEDEYDTVQQHQHETIKAEEQTNDEPHSSISNVPDVKIEVKEEPSVTSKNSDKDNE